MIIESINSLRYDALSRLADSYRIYSQGAQTVEEEQDEESALKENIEDKSSANSSDASSASSGASSDSEKRALVLNAAKSLCLKLLAGNKSLSKKYNNYIEKYGLGGDDTTSAAKELCSNLLSDKKIATKYNNYMKKYLGYDPSDVQTNNSAGDYDLSDLTGDAPLKEFI